MASQLRHLLHTYTSRRSPWGPPWWIYGVAFGAANLVRQGVIIVTSADISQAFRVASWVATALAVILVVNTVAIALGRRGTTGRMDDPTAGHLVTTPSPDETVVHRPLQRRPTTSPKWAPWWAYVAIIVGANYLRRAVAADGSEPAARVVVAVALSAALFVIITVVARQRRPDPTRRTGRGTVAREPDGRPRLPHQSRGDSPPR
jgi:hypothetical protein